MSGAGKTPRNNGAEAVELNHFMVELPAKRHRSIAQISCCCCYLLLLFLLITTNIINPDVSIILLLFQSLPLLVVLPGIYRNRYQAYSWLCFIILMYFTAYVVEVGSPLREWTDYLGLTLSILIFVSAMFTSRQLQRSI